MKIPFLVIFFFMNYTFLNRYSYPNPLLLLVAFTLQNFGLHMFNNYFDMKEDEITGQAKVLSNKKVLLFLSVASTLVSLFMIVFYNFSLICYATLFILMFAYSVPLGKNFRIKNVLFLKNITGSLFWWYLPFVMISSFHTNNQFSDIFITNLFVLATFMPFEPLWDIKDMEGDLKAGIKTIPNQYGINATKLLVASCFLLLGIIKLSSYNLSSITLFGPLVLFSILIKEKTSILAYQLMMLFLPLHIIISLLLK